MSSMVIPVSQHKLIKIRKKNRIKLTRLALYCSTVACVQNLIGSSSNNWIYTSEVLKYYVLPNKTQNFDDHANQPVYFKNATLGPWKFCWLDPITEFHCHSVQYIQDDDPSDVTTSVQQSVRRAFFFMMSGVILDLMGVGVCVICLTRKNPYASLFTSAVIHIFAGIANFLCIIVYMSAVSKEVGNKIFPASEMDDPLFHYSYGFSFILLKCSFLMTEVAALFTVVVFMAKRDERTFHRYKLRSLMNFRRVSEGGHLTDQTPEPTNVHGHARFQQRRSTSVMHMNRPSLDSFIPSPTPSRHELTIPDPHMPFFMRNMTPFSGNKGVPNRFPVERKLSSIQSDSVHGTSSSSPDSTTTVIL